MIIRKLWLETETRRTKHFAFVQTRSWHRQGWYLFGIVPLYIRDVSPRGDFQ